MPTVIQRLCVVPRADAATTEERLMRLVPETWDAAMLDEHHALIKCHAQALCTFNDPRCADCPLLKICPSGQRNLAELNLTAPPL
jgi:endonuclease-3